MCDVFWQHCSNIKYYFWKMIYKTFWEKLSRGFNFILSKSKTTLSCPYLIWCLTDSHDFLKLCNLQVFFRLKHSALYTLLEKYKFLSSSSWKILHVNKRYFYSLFCFCILAMIKKFIWKISLKCLFTCWEII